MQVFTVTAAAVRRNWPLAPARTALGLSAGLLLAACGGGGGGTLDWDLRNNDSATSGAAERATGNRPAPDSNGVISYPNYQVAVAKRGDTVTSLAARIGLSGAQLASFNALQPDDTLRPGEVLALPVRVAASAGTAPVATSPTAPSTGGLDVTSIATTALDRVDQTAPAVTPAPFASTTSGPAPVRYQVKRGETAFSIARQFNISAKSLADWNGLGPDLAVREGQYLIIPTAQDATRLPTPTVDASLPGQGSVAPEPPSASTPLPDEDTPTAAQVAASVPASPDLAATRTASSAAQFAMPAAGSVIRAYKKGSNDGIDIGAAPGATVMAAAAGVVAAVTKDPKGDVILVLKHAGGLLTVYTGIDSVSVAQGDSITRGQSIAKIAPGSEGLHFEVRQGLQSVDPLSYL